MGQRSEQLRGALWVLPLLFVVGALVLGSTLSQITIELARHWIRCCSEATPEARRRGET